MAMTLFIDEMSQAYVHMTGFRELFWSLSDFLPQMLPFLNSLLILVED